MLQLQVEGVDGTFECTLQYGELCNGYNDNEKSRDTLGTYMSFSSFEDCWKMGKRRRQVGLNQGPL